MKLSVVLSAQAAKFEAATFQGDLNDNLAAIAQMGYDGVELAIRDPEQVDGQSILDQASRHQLEISAIGTGQAWGEEGLSFSDPDPQVRQNAIQRIIKHLPIAAKCQAILIIGLIRGVPKPEQDIDQSLAWMTEALTQCGQAASDKGVRLAIEPISRLETPLINTVEQGLDLIDRIGIDNLGLLLDTYHMYVEERSLLKSIRLAKGHIVHFHVADSNRCHPGAGDLDFGAILNELDKTGYSGYISGEFKPEPDAHTAARNAIEHLKKLGKGQS
ncbi:MAG: sugar phosphate isomerase/epimerase [Deltaproteobacteria bacterium]|nr:sugar phosphate isomerase/epimerase [Deltaproteobacteria bacterium]